MTKGRKSLFLKLLETYFLPNPRRGAWLARLAGQFNLFYPAEIEKRIHWQRYNSGEFQLEGVALKRIRAAEPIKGFLFAPRERVASFPQPLAPESVNVAPGPGVRTLLFGVKGCDLPGLAVHERMFLSGEFKDPFYAQRLKNTVLVASDCPIPEQTCFCNLLGLKPYVTEGVDLSVSVLDEGWLVEVLTERGKGLIEEARDGFQKAGEELIAKREGQRQRAMQLLKEQNPREWNPELAQAIAIKSRDLDFWQKAAGDCVECFGCLLTCPTCFCYLLYDQGNAERFERTRVWDFCYLPMYARVGGGANPRPRFIQRFINRFQCKFMHSKNQNGFYACSGCGRCFTTCMGKIDIRNILGQL